MPVCASANRTGLEACPTVEPQLGRFSSSQVKSCFTHDHKVPSRFRWLVGQAVSLPDLEMAHAIARQADSLPHGARSGPSAPSTASIQSTMSTNQHCFICVIGGWQVARA